MCVRVCVCLGEVLRAVNPLACPPVSASYSTVSGSARRCIFSPSQWLLGSAASLVLSVNLVYVCGGRSLALPCSRSDPLPLSRWHTLSPHPTYRLLNFQLFFFLLLLPPALLLHASELRRRGCLTWHRVSLKFLPGFEKHNFCFFFLFIIFLATRPRRPRRPLTLTSFFLYCK